jgi:hypothetical protein
MARIDERFDEARRAVERLMAVPAVDPPATDGSPSDPAGLVSDARLLRFGVAFEAVWYAARQLMLDRYGPIQGTADGTIRACGDVGLLSPDLVDRLRRTAVFHAALAERCRKDGTHGAARELADHVSDLAEWMAAIDARYTAA